MNFDKFAGSDGVAVAGSEVLVDLATRQLTLRDWERQHLPIEASQIGYELFLVLAKFSRAGWRDRSGLLKQLYLALPQQGEGDPPASAWARGDRLDQGLQVRQRRQGRADRTQRKVLASAG